MVQNREIDSKYTGDTYKIEILYPMGYQASESYPIVYCLDWIAYRGLITNTKGLLSHSNQIEPVIIVGVSNIGGWSSYFADRTRDFTPYNVPNLDSKVKGESKNSGITGGAVNFLSFMKNELIPTVEGNLNSEAGKRGIVGYSFGGLFATYTLLNTPDLFSRYLIGSPSIWFDDFKLIKTLNSEMLEKINIGNSIYLSVGEEEIGNQISGYGYLVDELKKIEKKIDFKNEIIDGEGHSTAVIGSYLKGLRYLYRHE